MLRSIAVAMLTLKILAAAPALAVQGFPAYFTLPKSVILYDEGSLSVESLAEVAFPLAEGRTVTKAGKHYRSYLKFGPEELNRPADATWKEWRPALEASGWVVQGNDGATTYTLMRKAGGLESWLRIGLGDYDSPLVELIEIAGGGGALTLKPPAAQPESFGPNDDFPYFTPPAGAVISGTGNYDDPLDVTQQGTDSEAALVGTGYLVKYYTPPASLSRFEFEKVYREALAKAGWQVKPLPPGKAMEEGHIVAHFQNATRNLWLTADRGADNGTTGLTVKVADLGAEDWGKRLDRDCRLPLYGVTFDFNKATLKPESLAVLQKAKAVLASRASLAVEVQGHTDNVGQDDYNVKLSQARAQTVLDWLVQNGIAAARLKAQGYGETRPIADNGNDAGRALNRRVELVRAGCQH